jgi:DNA sulfur modification protein DndD
MKLRIESIKYKNIREFGDLELDFTRSQNSETHQISLVQMPNGTGKTTTMGLIRHLLLGTELEADQVKEYRHQDGASEGKFSMAFATESQRFRIHMHLDYDAGTVSYRTSFPKREGGGTKERHFLPRELDETLTKAFIDLFIFNGELTSKFIETDENEAETALKIVNRLDRIETQRDRISRIVKKRQEHTDGATTAQGLRANRTSLQKSKNKLDDLRRKKDDLESEIEDHETNIEDYKIERKETIAENKEALEQYTDLGEDIKELESELYNDSSRLLAEMRRPSQLSEELNEDFQELLEHMTILRLPKSTSEEFFNELSEGKDCVCGRPLDEEHRESIRQNAEEYLSDEDIGVLNTLKEQLRNTATPFEFQPQFEDLSETRQALKRKEMKQDGLDLDDPELEDRKQELTELIESEKNARDRKQDTLELLTTDDKDQRERFDLDWESNIPMAKRRVNKFEEKVERASNTVTFSKKADKLEAIFNQFLDRSSDQLKRNQITKTNERLTHILGYSEVQIESIDNSIKLKGKSGASEGQSLSVAYAYLSTLFEDSAVDMPFVIDSPAVSLDHKVRQKVAPKISNLFDQLIAFVISTEKDGFVDHLAPQKHNGAPDIQYYTVYKTEKESGNIQKHTDKDYFMEFTSEEEVNNARTTTEAE